MVAPLEDDRAPVPDPGTGDAERQVVRLAAGVREEHDLERRGQGGGQRLGVVGELAVEVTGVRVQPRRLSGDGGGDRRMRVSDLADIVHEVEVVPSGGVVEERAPPPDEVDRRGVVGHAEGRAEAPAAFFEETRFPVQRVRGSGEGVGAAGESLEKRRGVGAERGEGFEVRGGGGRAKAIPVGEGPLVRRSIFLGVGFQGDLELQVRGPAAVPFGIGDAPEPLTRGDGGARRRRAFPGQSAVDGAERPPGGQVPQFHAPAAAGYRVRAGVDDFAGERGSNRGSRRREHLDSRTHGAALRGGGPAFVNGEHPGQPGLAVSPEREPPSPVRRAANRALQRPPDVCGIHGEALRGKVERDAARCSRVPLDRRRRVLGGLPPADGGGHRRMTGGEPEPRGGDPCRFLRERGQDPEDAGLAHQQVGIGLRHPRPADRRDPAAHERAGRVGRAEEVRLLAENRPFRGEPGQHPGGGPERFRRIERQVERRGRRFHDPRAGDGVAEVEEGEVLRPAGLRFPGGEEQVVVVRVVVERAGRQGEERREPRPDLAGQPPVEIGPLAGLGALGALGRGRRERPRPRLDDRFGVSRRPGDLLLVQPRVIEIGQRVLQASEQPAGGGEQRRGPAEDPGQRRPVEIGEEPRPAPAAGAPQLRARFAGERGKGLRDAEPRVRVAGVRDHGAQHVEPRGRLSGGAYLEHEPPPAFGPIADEEVPVALPGERRRFAADPPVFRGQRRGFLRGHLGPPAHRVMENGETAGRSLRLRHQRNSRRMSPSFPA